MIVHQLRKFLQGEVSRYLNRNSPFSGIWENIIQQHDDALPEETRHLIAEYLLPKYKKLFADIAESNFVFYLPPGKTFQTAHLQKIQCSAEFLSPQFTVSFTGKEYEVECFVNVAASRKSISANEISSPLVF